MSTDITTPAAQEDTTPATSKASGLIWEGRAQVTIMLAIGGASAAASFTHVASVAAAHGQAGWLAWADAVTLELMSIASGLEMRRRKRAHLSTRMPFGVLLVAVALSLSAQILQAEQSVIGWVAAAIPALGFLAMAKMALGRAPVVVEPEAEAEEISDEERAIRADRARKGWETRKAAEAAAAAKPARTKVAPKAKTRTNTSQVAQAA